MRRKRNCRNKRSCWPCSGSESFFANSKTIQITDFIISAVKTWPVELNQIFRFSFAFCFSCILEPDIDIH